MTNSTAKGFTNPTRIVPAEPTEEMVEAAYGVMDNRHTGMLPMKAALTAAFKKAMEEQ